MIFSEFCKIFAFIEKEKKKTKEKKKKSLHGLDLAHNKVGPTTRIQSRLKNKPTRRPTQI